MTCVVSAAEVASAFFAQFLTSLLPASVSSIPLTGTIASVAPQSRSEQRSDDFSVRILFVSVGVDLHYKKNEGIKGRINEVVQEWMNKGMSVGVRKEGRDEKERKGGSNE